MSVSTLIRRTSIQLRIPVLTRRTFVVPALFVVLAITMVFCMGVGAVSINPSAIGQIILYQMGMTGIENLPDHHISVVTSIRMPRILLGAIVGACLGVSGAVLQSLFRNPLAEPALVGVSSGCSLGAVATIFFGGFITQMLGETSLIILTPLSAFLGGIIVTVLVYLLATRESQTDMSIMLLAGIAMNALAGAGVGMFIFMSDDQQVREILFWMFGSLGGAMWRTLLPTLPIMIIGLGIVLFFGYSLNLYLLGEKEAKHLGINVQVLKWLLIAMVTMIVGATVSLSGIIGFVGLVVPHLLRLSFGPDNRLLLPASALLGGILLLLADLLARTIVAPTELPIGLVTSLLGSPFFLYLLIRQKRVIRF